MSLVFIIPMGILQAITNNAITLDALSEVLGGFILPGKTIPVSIFKAFGYLTVAQALEFVGGLKLAHYMKIPPRAMFRAQIIPTLLSIVVVMSLGTHGD